MRQGRRNLEEAMIYILIIDVTVLCYMDREGYIVTARHTRQKRS